ncbi:MAG: tetratricopeptide repeat protein [Firmicutes bacterium]|nr:tetratricopeptide repeat protein [Bacillota bacterium]
MDNHYVTLGVPVHAAPEDIRKAYFRLIRRFPPETHPEEFQRIRTAYEVLSDPVAKQRYDAFLKQGSRINELLEAAALHEAQEDWYGAVEVFLKLLQFLPEDPDLSLRLGECYLRLHSYKKAAEIFEKLVKKDDQEFANWFGLGRAYLGQAVNEEERTTRFALLTEARDAFGRAQRLEPKERAVYSLLGTVYEIQGDFSSSIVCLKQGIAANGAPSFGDLGLLIQLCGVLLVRNQLGEAKEYFGQIAEIAVSDPYQRSYAAQRLVREAARWTENYRYDLAVPYVEQANRLSPEDFGRDSVDWLADMAASIAALEKIKYAYIPPIYELSRFIIHEHHMCGQGEELSESRRIEFRDALVEDLLQYSPQELLSNLERLRQEYPALIRLDGGWFSSLETLCREELDRQRTAGSKSHSHVTAATASSTQTGSYSSRQAAASPSRSSGGGKAVGAVVGGVIGAAVGGPIGAIIGAWLGSSLGGD